MHLELGWGWGVGVGVVVMVVGWEMESMGCQYIKAQRKPGEKQCMRWGEALGWAHKGLKKKQVMRWGEALGLGP